MEKEIKDITNELLEYYNLNKSKHPVELVIKLHDILYNTYRHQFVGNEEEMMTATPFMAKHLVLKAMMAYSNFIMHLYLNDDKLVSYFFISSHESYLKIMHTKTYDFLFVDNLLNKLMEVKKSFEGKSSDDLFEALGKLIKDSDAPGKNKNTEK